jgi:hypothetical protein
MKLAMNHLVHRRAMDLVTGHIKLGWKLIAGAAAGGCQVVCPKSVFSCLTFILLVQEINLVYTTIF